MKWKIPIFECLKLNSLKKMKKCYRTPIYSPFDKLILIAFHILFYLAIQHVAIINTQKINFILTIFFFSSSFLSSLVTGKPLSECAMLSCYVTVFKPTKIHKYYIIRFPPFLPLEISTHRFYWVDSTVCLKYSHPIQVYNFYKLKGYLSLRVLTFSFLIESLH